MKASLKRRSHLKQARPEGKDQPVQSFVHSAHFPQAMVALGACNALLWCLALHSLVVDSMSHVIQKLPYITTILFVHDGSTVCDQCMCCSCLASFTDECACMCGYSSIHEQFSSADSSQQVALTCASVSQKLCKASDVNKCSETILIDAASICCCPVQCVNVDPDGKVSL